MINYKSNIWKLYAIRFFHNLIPAYVIERLFWEQRGMTIQMVVYAEIIYAVTIVLLEIPTGIIADRWSRKKMIVLNAFLGCLQCLILIFATSFWHFALVVFLAGIGCSVSSGSGNALLYDSLLLTNNEESFEKCLGRLNFSDFSALILAALSGSLLASRYPFELNYWLSSIGMFISLSISLTLVEPCIKSTLEEAIPIKRYVSTSIDFFRKNRGVSLVLLSGMVTGSTLTFLDEFWQIHVSRLGIHVVYFGLVSASMMFSRLPGSIFAYILKRKLSYKALFYAALSIFTIGFLYMSLVKNLSALVAIFALCAFSGLIEPLVSGYLHHRIDSSMRATIDSFQSLGLRALGIIVGLGFGFFSSRFDIFGGYGFLSLSCGIFLVYFFISSRNIIENK